MTRKIKFEKSHILFSSSYIIGNLKCLRKLDSQIDFLLSLQIMNDFSEDIILHNGVRMPRIGLGK